MPHMKNKAIAWAAAVAVVGGVVLGGETVASNRNTLRHQQQEDAKLCHYNMVQNVILIAQLQGALVRVRASVPKNNPVRQQQEQVLAHGIRALRRLKC